MIRLLASLAAGTAAVLALAAAAPAQQAPDPASCPVAAQDWEQQGGHLSYVERRDCSEAARAVTILISIDGFRADYLKLGVTPNLNALAAGGISAAMRPSFPSKTFPNHYAIVTGLRPDRNGIVSNSMKDPSRDDKFTMSTTDPYWWSSAVPIWVDAEKANVRTATMFWPGSAAANGGTKASEWPHEITGGTRPSDWWPFDQAVSGEQRVRGAIDWLRRPAATRPKFVTLYFDTVDTAGHDYGPGSREVTEAVAGVDQLVGTLMEGLKGLGQPVNLVIVADHGMAPLSKNRVVLSETLADPADATLFESGPFASYYPVAGHEAALEAKLLRHHDHVECWRKADIPERFHYGKNPRVPPYFCLAQTGWFIAKDAKERIEGGTHGYDNMSPEMAALFVANGPAFRHDVALKPFDNVDVYALLRDVLHLPPAADVDGTDAPFTNAMEPR